MAHAPSAKASDLWDERDTSEGGWLSLKAASLLPGHVPEQVTSYLHAAGRNVSKE